MTNFVLYASGRSQKFRPSKLWRRRFFLRIAVGLRQRIKGRETKVTYPFHAVMITIPDTVEGAVIISIVDFILSFVIISGIGGVLALLPLVNRFWSIDDKDLKGGH
jgi:hypothetical protein